MYVPGLTLALVHAGETRGHKKSMGESTEIFIKILKSIATHPGGEHEDPSTRRLLVGLS